MWPHIAILTPTKGRSKYLHFQAAQMKLIDYPQDKISWIITDTEVDGDNGWEDISSLYPSAIYVKIPAATLLGKSRNIGIDIALEETPAEYIFLMDDDDIINPARFKNSINVFNENPATDLVGCSRALMYNLRTRALIRCPRFVGSHTLEPYLGCRREYAKTHSFDENDPRGRLVQFMDRDTKGLWISKLVQMPAEDVCIIIGHDTNTFDKYQVESSLDKYRIKEIRFEYSLTCIYEMFGTAETIQPLFEKAYADDMYPISETYQKQRMLNNLKTQYHLDCNLNDSVEQKLFKLYEYNELKKFIEYSPNIKKYICLQDIKKEYTFSV